ncbi:twin-arginine translocation signal domain-containing protein [Campylobacter sp. RM10541]|uniref:twin-arginine translocation signal domain-containing protein n=1 Tax=Campylobacter molothri TaxID=1032242 RepID=UPI001DBF750D|nr:twin-arginine translocation signal domain-containing protein [Campylobacter sp. RM10536]MBZ7957450.1 twin-arginine translocation signal domain-containing protein [Campylobacter sp. RM10541]
MQNRREFLKKSALALGSASLLPSTTLAFTKEENKDIIKGKSKKKEVLFQRSVNWENYYIKAE